MAASLIGDRTQYAKELLGPYVVGGVLGCLAYFYVDAGAQPNTALYDRLYSGVLSVAAAFSGFALGYYTLIRTKATPFLQRVSGHGLYRILLTQIKEAVFWVVILVALTGVYYVAQIVPQKEEVIYRSLFSIWVACAGIAAYSWTRVTKNTLEVMNL